MGCSPYFTLTGTYPVLPLDIIEVTYLLPTPDSFPMSTTDLRASHSHSLMCRIKDIARFQTAVYAAPIDATHHMVTLHPPYSVSGMHAHYTSFLRRHINVLTVHLLKIEESTDEDLNEEDKTPIDGKNSTPEEVDIADLQFQ